MLKSVANREIELLVNRYPVLARLEEDIVSCVQMLKNCYHRGNKILVCGNGGSAADSLQIVGELMKSFTLKRRLPEELRQRICEECGEAAPDYIENLQRAIPALALVSETALMTAYANDNAADFAIAQQVLGYGKPGDVLIAISTSGNSANVLHAARIAKVAEVKVISLTGEGGGKLRGLSDVCIAVPSRITYQIQELHLPVYHCICLALEAELFSEDE